MEHAQKNGGATIINQVTTAHLILLFRSFFCCRIGTPVFIAANQLPEPAIARPEGTHKKTPAAPVTRSAPVPKGGKTADLEKKKENERK